MAESVPSPGGAPPSFGEPRPLFDTGSPGSGPSTAVPGRYNPGALDQGAGLMDDANQVPMLPPHTPIPPSAGPISGWETPVPPTLPDIGLPWWQPGSHWNLD